MAYANHGRRARNADYVRDAGATCANSACPARSAPRGRWVSLSLNPPYCLVACHVLRGYSYSDATRPSRWQRSWTKTASGKVWTDGAARREVLAQKTPAHLVPRESDDSK